MTESRGAGKADRDITNQRRHRGGGGRHDIRTVAQHRHAQRKGKPAQRQHPGQRGWVGWRSLSGVGRERVGLLRSLGRSNRFSGLHLTLRKGIIPQPCGRGPRRAHWTNGRLGIVERGVFLPPSCDRVPRVTLDQGLLVGCERSHPVSLPWFSPLPHRTGGIDLGMVALTCHL